MLVVGPDFCIKENGPVKSSYKMNFLCNHNSIPQSRQQFAIVSPVLSFLGVSGGEVLGERRKVDTLAIGPGCIFFPIII